MADNDNPPPVTDETRPRCGSCPHYHPDTEAIGHCRRNPPTNFLLHAINNFTKQQSFSFQSAYPPTPPDKWCGEHPEWVRWYSNVRQIKNH